MKCVKRQSEESLDPENGFENADSSGSSHQELIFIKIRSVCHRLFVTIQFEIRLGESVSAFSYFSDGEQAERRKDTMKTVSRKLITKLLAGVLAVAMTIAFVPAFASPASAAVKYKKVSTENYTVKLPTGKTWKQASQTLDPTTLGAGTEGQDFDLSVISGTNYSAPESVDVAYSARTLKKGTEMVSFAGMESTEKVTTADLKKVKIDKGMITLLNQAISGNETLAAYGKIKVKSISTKMVKVKKYKTALKMTVNGSFDGQGYKVTAKPVVYITVKNNHVLLTCGAGIKTSNNGKTIKITSSSSENTMAKTALESVTIKK